MGKWNYWEAGSFCEYAYEDGKLREVIRRMFYFSSFDFMKEKQMLKEIVREMKTRKES